MFTVLKAAGMASSYWPDALAHCVYTYNRMPTKANPGYLSPYHMYRGKAPRLKHLRAFGCDCTYWAAKSMTKGSGRSGVFLGYTPKSPDGTYRISPGFTTTSTYRACSSSGHTGDDDDDERLLSRPSASVIKYLQQASVGHNNAESSAGYIRHVFVPAS